MSLNNSLLFDSRPTRSLHVWAAEMCHATDLVNDLEVLHVANGEQIKWLSFGSESRE